MEPLSELYESWKAVQPLSEEDKDRLDRKFMLDFNYNSNHIEGNTLTYGQTEVLLMLGSVLGPAKMRDLEEMKAHNMCIYMMRDEALSGNPLTETFLRQLHHTMLREDYVVERRLPDGRHTSYTIHAGCYKTRPNSVITPAGDRFDYASPEETPALMHDLVDWYNYAEQNKLLSPAVLAAMFHYRYIRIHPFEDGNGRIARLMLNFILLRHGYPMVVVPSAKKNAYLAALAAADAQTGKVPSDGAHARLDHILDFVKYIEGLVASTIVGDLAFIKTDTAVSWWYNTELVKFRSPNTPRILAMLSEHPNMTLSEMAKVLGINVSAVQKQIKSLADKGYILRTTKPLTWRVIITSTKANK